MLGKQCTELLYILIANKTATIIEKIILFDVSAYAEAIIRNRWKQLERKNKNVILRYSYSTTSHMTSCVSIIHTLLHHIHHYVWVKLHWTDSPKFNHPNQRTQIWSTFWNLQTFVGQSQAPFQLQATGNIGKHRRSEETLPTQVTSDTATPARSQRRWFIYPLPAF